MNREHRGLGDSVDRLYAGGLVLSYWQAVFVCLLAGFVCNFGIVPFFVWPAYALSLMALIWMLDAAGRARRPALVRWGYGSLFAAGLIAGGLSWLISDLARDGHQQVLAFRLGMVVLQAVAWGAIIAVFSLAWRPGPARICVFCLAVYVAESVRALWSGGVIWNPAALVWVPGSAVSQIASVIGVNGLSALTIGLFAAPMAMVDRRSCSPALRVLPLVVVGACLGVLWGWGAQRLDSQTATAGNGDQTPLRLIDASAGPPETALQRYLAATGLDGGEALADEIVIWPERATGHFLFQSTRYVDPIAQVLGDRVLIAGSMRSQPSGVLSERTDVYNSLAVLTSDSVRRGPFAVHDVSRQPLFGGVLDGRRFVVGLSPFPIRLEGIPVFMPLIGAEALTSWREPAQSERPAWIVHLSDERSRNVGYAHHQSYAHARYRSIESGLPMARVSAGGISGVVDGFGRSVPEQDSDGVDESESVARIGRNKLPSAGERTLFSSGWGRYFAVFFIVFNLSLFVWMRM